MAITIKRRVERKKLSDTVEEELEQMIRQGEIPEGDALPSERDLMAAFGVGRPSIRDALSGLARKRPCKNKQWRANACYQTLTGCHHF